MTRKEVQAWERIVRACAGIQTSTTLFVPYTAYKSGPQTSQGGLPLDNDWVAPLHVFIRTSMVTGWGLVVGLMRLCNQENKDGYHNDG
ncbi:hypothetical protein IW261DRAFT_795591 [Armillaria novae-zelandiae]|uniref:Uncharacterized protein n=1 Tax=Armillaria novae-zelandiae TaxID=153914 RepID=A0AA39PM78_9AGAR|nr:hypothetical protein IW261DRAFT_795591 [Armillaria novae-zelandiae]